MKKVVSPELILIFDLFLFSQLSFAQSPKPDTLKPVAVVGVFDGAKVTVGNFETEEVYIFKDYYISLADLPGRKADSLRGKKILVTGRLKVVEGKRMPAKTSTDGKIYEPYKEPDKKFISKPVFSIVYDSREPVSK